MSKGVSIPGGGRARPGMEGFCKASPTTFTPFTVPAQYIPKYQLCPEPNYLTHSLIDYLMFKLWNVSKLKNLGAIHWRHDGHITTASCESINGFKHQLRYLNFFTKLGSIFSPKSVCFLEAKKLFANNENTDKWVCLFFSQLFSQSVPF